MTKYTIRPITLCRYQAEKGILTYLSYYGTKIWRPYIIFLIEGADQNILVDTAMNAEDFTQYYPANRNVPIEEIASFEDALAKMSLKPENIDIVIQTHLHADHCLNTPKCKNARVLVQEEELKYALNPHPVFANMYPQSVLSEVNFETVKGREMILPGIELIPVPGHTPGCQAVAVDTELGRVIIPGFCCIKENFYPPEDIQEKVSPFAGYPVIIPGINFNAALAYESMLKIKEMADIILPMHEPELMDCERIPN